MQPENRKAVDKIDSELRYLDPLETVAAGYDDTELTADAEQDIGRVDNMLGTDGSLTQREKMELYELGANLRMDWLYAQHGGRQLPLAAFAGRVKEAEGFIQRAAEQAIKTHERHPQDFWSLRTKFLDLRAFAAHRFAADSQTTLKGTPEGQKLFEHSQNIMKSVLGDSLRLMHDMEKFGVGNDKLAEKARGSLYELMLVTYLRFGIYKERTFDKTFVRSALSREDKPVNGYVYPNRAFDIVIETPEDKRLLQAKNHKENEEYAWPIQKVTDEHFAKTLDNLPKFIQDFGLILDNPKDPLMQVPLIKAQRRLDGVFGAQLAQKA